MSKSHKLAWAAGFIDGGGFITIQNRKSVVNGKTYSGQYLRLGYCQASEAPLKELQSIFGGTIRIKNSGPNRDSYNRLVQYIWTLSTQQAAEAISNMLPYLIHKKEVALLALQFQETMSKTKQQLSEETKTYRLEIQLKITSINSES